MVILGILSLHPGIPAPASSSERQRSAAFLRASQLPFCRAFSTLSSSGRISASRSRKQWIMGDDNGILSIRHILINNDSIIIIIYNNQYKQWNIIMMGNQDESTKY